MPLMDIPDAERLEFLESIMKGVEPAFKITQQGDPIKMADLKATLPNRYTAYKISEMKKDLMEIELSLLGGG